MGTFNGGILGGFNGKVGSVIGTRWRGKSVLRGLPNFPKNRKQNPALQEQQAKFSLMAQFLQPVNKLVQKTYDNLPSSMTGSNKAFSDNVRNAVTGVYPALTIDYSKVVLSKGVLPDAESAVATSTVAGKLVFTWTDNSATGDADAKDIAFVAIYCEALQRWILRKNTVARNAGTYSLDVPAFSGKAVQTYIGFMSVDGKSVSNSLYAGLVNVL